MASACHLKLNPATVVATVTGPVPEKLFVNVEVTQPLTNPISTLRPSSRLWVFGTPAEGGT